MIDPTIAVKICERVYLDLERAEASAAFAYPHLTPTEVKLAVRDALVRYVMRDVEPKEWAR